MSDIFGQHGRYLSSILVEPTTQCEIKIEDKHSTMVLLQTQNQNADFRKLA